MTKVNESNYELYTLINKFSKKIIKTNILLSKYEKDTFNYAFALNRCSYRYVKK
jgi:hypothetical protein